MAKLIRSKVQQYADEPTSLANNVKKLTGDLAGVVRIRVGDWRVFIDEDGNVITVVKIAPRGSAY